MKLKIIIILFFLCNTLHSQILSFYSFDNAYHIVIKEMNSSNNYFVSDNYYQHKNKDVSISVHEAIGNILNIKFKDQNEFRFLVTDIANNAIFEYSYCSDYDLPIVYNFRSKLGNKFRVNIEEKTISIEYPNSLSKFTESNRDFLPVFVCVSDNSYAYHTNIKCNPLNNCKLNIIETNIKTARNHNYKFCLVCSTLN